MSTHKLISWFHTCVPMDDRYFIVFRLDIVPTHSEASNSFGVGDSSPKKSVRARKGGDKCMSS
ncbi:hypothetical protein RHMOL_Rhmol09G0047200 [Rhododendron molle]|uniref:Uncharacterized protein n=1 Tax=Rhododendron molle TaxID=49168 RepID=A0ACC0M9T6_RHOML|nr:hypothetical protein RHMOL_Rhmol09G0047200 [Rhododendron molle]